VAFAAQSLDLRRSPLVARTSRIQARSSWLAAPCIQFLFVDSQLLLLASFSADLAVGIISPCDLLGVLATKSPRGLAPPGHAHAGHTRVDPGRCLPGPPTDPDVHDSRIRLFETWVRYASAECTMRGGGSANRSTTRSSVDQGM